VDQCIRVSTQADAASRVLQGDEAPLSGSDPGSSRANEQHL